MARRDGDPRVLRVGMIRGGRIVEERLLTPGEAVSVGPSPSETFQLPELAQAFVLIERKRSNYKLNLAEGLEGKVSQGGEVRTLDRVRAELPSQAGGRWLALDGDVRGKVSLGEVSFLFQLVPPPVGAGGPGVDRRGFSALRHVDRVLLALLVVSVAMHSSFISYAWAQPAPPAFQLEEWEPAHHPGPLRRIKPEPPPPEPPVVRIPVKPPKPTAGEAPTKVKPSPEEVAAASRKKVESIALIEKLRTTGHSELGGASLVGILDAPSQNLDEVLSAGVVVRADTGLKSVSLGEPQVRAFDGPEIGPVEVKVASRTQEGPKVALAPPEDVTGGLSVEKLGRVVEGYRPQLTVCHTRELNRNPGLEGRVALRIVVHGDGSVLGVEVVENQTYSANLEGCLVARVKRWRFPEFEGPDASFSMPLVFTAP